MDRKALGNTGFEIAPIVFGGNVFGWTLDEQESLRILDAFIDHGFDAIDTADAYSRWAEGNKGGESETILGKWFKARPGMRDMAKRFYNEKGMHVLSVLDDVAASHNAELAEVALAWIIRSEGVTAPIASATSLDQIESFARAVELVLSDEDMARLTTAGL